MMTAISHQPRRFYVAGGTLPPNSPSYVARLADDELESFIRAGEYCYVLNSRQTGKSSLMARVARHLETDGYTTVIVDLSVIGAGDEEQWYNGILHEILKKLPLAPNLATKQQELDTLSPPHRFTELLRAALESNESTQLVVFVDEIDKTLQLDFTDDFFGAVRSFHNHRDRNPAFERLIFVLLGVASPEDLVKRTDITPFNIGERVKLRDFDVDQLHPLTAGLAVAPAIAERVLQRIYYWTNGHPYLTQTLFKVFAERGDPDNAEDSVDQLVEKLFHGTDSRRQESNLANVRRRINCEEPEVREEQLELYQRVLHGGVLDDTASVLVNSLKLTGLVTANHAGKLQVRNRIYATVFDADWVREHLSRERRQRWLVPAGIFAAFYVVFAIWQFLAIQSATNAVELASESPHEMRSPDSHYELLRYFGLGAPARVLMAKFHMALATRAAAVDDVEDELLQRLKALTYRDTEERRERIFYLTQRLEGLVASFENREGSRALAVDAARDRWVTVDDTGQATLWSRRSGEQSAELDEATAAVFLPNGRGLITGDVEGRLRFWQIDERDELTRIATRDGAHKAAISTLNVSSNGHLLASGSVDQTVTIWILRRGRPIPEAEPRRLPFLNGLTEVAITASGRWLAGRMIRDSDGQSEKIVVIWHLGPRESEPFTLSHRDPVKALAFTADESHLLVAAGGLVAWELDSVRNDRDGQATLWAGEASDVTTMIPIPAAASRLGEILTGSEDGTVVAWNILAPELSGSRRSRAELIKAHALEGQRQAIRWLTVDPQRERIAASSELGRISFWQPPAATTLPTSGETTRLNFGPDLRHLAIGYSDGHVEVWELTGRTRSPSLFERESASVSAIAFQHESQWLATGYTDGWVRFWPLAGTSANVVSAPIWVGRKSLTALQIGPSGTTVAAGSSDGSVSLYEIEPSSDGRRDFKWVYSLTKDATDAGVQIDHLEFSGDGRWLKAVNIYGELTLWDLSAPPADTPPAALQLPENRRRVTVSLFGPKHRWLATGTLVGVASEVQVWDLTADDPVAEAVGSGLHQEPVISLCFSPDGTRLLSSDSGGAFQHWFLNSQGNLVAESDDALSRTRWPPGILAAEFGADNEVLVLFRDVWIHTFSAHEEGDEWIESRFLHGNRQWRHFGFAGDAIKLASESEDWEAIEIESLSLLARGLEEPKRELQHWERRLALVFRSNAVEPEPWRQNW